MLPLKSSRACVSAASGSGRSTASRAGELDVGARGVEVRVVRHHVPGLAHHGEQDALGRAALVGRDHVAEAGQLSGPRFFRRKKLSLPAYDSSPRIIAAHCSVDMALVPESVSRSIRMSRGVDEEEVVAGCFEITSRAPRAWCGAAARRS